LQQTIQSILGFWFGPIKGGFSLEAKQALWFQLNSETDKEIANRFGAEEHCEIIDRFDRFPHRNKVLGRVSTEEELDWLEDGATFDQ